MKAILAIAVVAACLGTNALAAVTTLSGTVSNGTTGKPAAGDEVVLISLANGMTETARARSDARGRFSFTISDADEPRLVRVLHQGVPYHAMTRAGGSSIGVQVFDVANKLEGVNMAVDVQRFQAHGDTLQVIEQIAVRNTSQPPQTLMNERPLEIQLPPEARVDSAVVQSGGGQPLTQTLAPGDQKGHYYFRFPLRPGETRFQVVYRLAYKGQAVIEPKFFYPLERFVVVLPSSISFEAKTPGLFHSMQSKTHDMVQVAAPVHPGKHLAFRLSGAGTLAEVQQVQQQADPETTRPGGGLGPPTNLPDPLQDYRWLILGGVCAGLMTGAVLVTRTPGKQAGVQHQTKLQHRGILATQGRKARAS